MGKGNGVKEMTDLKMCDYRLYYVNKEGPHWEWTPIDPQPCCRLCEHYDDTMGFCPKVDGEIMNGLEDFYFCYYWEVKK
jgi:hypothetical protein